MVTALETVKLPMGCSSFHATLVQRGLGPLTRASVATLQINVGKLCNQACHHCHVEAGPKRPERMSPETAQRTIELLETSPLVETVDITGGAPELNEQFRRLVSAARQMGKKVMDRCNLTVLLEPGQEDLPEFLASHGVQVVASLPCYTEENVENQRGKGVFSKSIEALRRLNAVGYGRPDQELALDLVYNPGGPFLPPPQQKLEADYKSILADQFGVAFDSLLTLTNMPIKRFADTLERSGKYAEYMSLLVNHFNDATVPGLMCRAMVSVGWDGRLYDCDFNQMLDLCIPLPSGGAVRTLWDIDTYEQLVGKQIATDGHCFGCTAGSGSSCGGALA